MSIEDLINHVTDKNFAKAEPIFHDLIQHKMNDAFEAEKIKVAGQIFNNDPEEDEDDEDFELDLDDEDFDDLDDDNE
jgi:FKBP-type peptidyl-prolyl cis-trans isomerase (trigger factor)